MLAFLVVSHFRNYCPTCLLKVKFGQSSLNAGHVFAFGETRATAIANMVLGLKELHIRGEIRTNVDYTVDLLHVSNYFPMSCRLYIMQICRCMKPVDLYFQWHWDST